MVGSTGVLPPRARGRLENWHKTLDFGGDPCNTNSMIKENAMFNSALESLHQFCIEMHPDWCMVYDFMEAQVGKLTEEQWDEVEAVYNPYLNDSRY